MAVSKKRKAGPHVLTANLLRGGDVVYMSEAGSWASSFDHAQVFETPEEQEAALAYAEGDVEARLILDPYFFPVTEGDGGLTPTEQREIIRAKGPTVRLDLGKQASAGA